MSSQPSSTPSPHSTEASRPPLGPQQTPAQKRLTNLHITAYPGLINTDLLPEIALQATDFSAIDPTIHRKNHTVRNNNVTTFTVTGEDGGDGDGKPPSSAMLTEKQITAKLTSIGLELRKAAEQERKARIQNGEDASGPSPSSSTDMLCPRGYHKEQLAPPFDERTTYRMDYCQESPNGFADAARRAHLACYQEAWTEEEKKSVFESMKQPYLTCPESVCSDPRTEYRAEYMRDAEKTEYRTLPHRINLPELGTTFAYSAYSVDDPRRTISFDPKVASLKEPRNFLYNADSSNADADKPRHTAKEESELQKMRTLRTESLKRSCVLRESRRAAAGKSGDAAVGTAVPHSRRAEDYIYLPSKQLF